MDLARVRSGFGGELSNQRVRNGLFALTNAEVGGQGPQAQQAFMESVFNRAAARGKSLADTIYDRNYYPQTTFSRMGAAPSQNFQPILDSVLGGSNISNLATGNASGTVRFAGGPQTYAANGERFGIEGPDQKWAAGLGGPVPAAQPQPSPSPGAQTMDQAYPYAQPQQPGFLDTLNARVNAPTTQQGIGLLLAGLSGGNLNEGMSAGSSRANAYTQNMLQQWALEQERQQQVLSNQMLGNKTLQSSLPPEVMAGLASLAPQARAKMLGDILARRQDINQVGQLEMQKANIDLNKQIELARQQRQISIDMMDQVDKRMAPNEQRPHGLPGNARRAQDGKFYVPDPNRPGKYLMWQE